jgi:arylsulfatase A-like enzyme
MREAPGSRGLAFYKSSNGISEFMANPMTGTKKGSRGVLLSLLLGCGFLVTCVWWSFHLILTALADSMVTTGLDVGQLRGQVFLSRLGYFVAALLVIHLGLGLLVYGLARVTVGAAPRFAAGRKRMLVLIWFAVLVTWVLVVNASWYPSSRFAAEDSWLLREWFGIAPYEVLSGILALLVAALMACALIRHWQSRQNVALFSSAATLIVACWFLLGHASPQAPPAPPYAAPHIVIIGIDSLRNDLSGGGSADGVTPNIDQFLVNAHRFTDTITPFARTYPSWMSVLTGRHPVTTNARDNLMPRALVHEGDTLGDALIAQGYHSVYATDEVRFANFDESFGFDQVITPAIGLSDFLFGKASDLPLHNLLLNTRVGAWLFPDNYANRAVHVTYRPEQFVARLERELSIDRPTFISIHLTLAHWPYSWAGVSTPEVVQEYRHAYPRSIMEVDRQFADVLGLLRQKGVLENAIVVVLSDHGEALGGQTDSMLRKTGTGTEIWNSLWGHGTSVMSPHQYAVLFAMRAFGRASLPGVPMNHSWPVSLEDIRPTLQQMATGAPAANVDGKSLLPYLAGTSPASQLDSRIRFTETGFSTNRVLAGHYGSTGLIRESIQYFEFVPESGWVQLRPDRLGELMAQKQRAALSRNSLLAAIPSWTDDTVTYLFTSRQSPLPRRLSGRPDPAADPEAARLWDAIQARFPGELQTAAGLP